MNDSRTISLMNRSKSSPNIYSPQTSVQRRIYVEEIVKEPGSDVRLIRHFSCEEILNGKYKDEENIASYGSTSFYNDNTAHMWNSNMPNLKSIHPSNIKKEHYEETPMEIDMSDSKIETQDIIEVEYTNTPHIIHDVRLRKSNRRPVKEINIRRLVPEPPTENRSTLKYIGTKSIKAYNLKGLLYIFMLVLLVISGTILYYLDPLFENHNMIVQKVTDDLNVGVINQEGPVIIVSRSLKTRDRWAKKTKVLPFVGSSGVGKTYIANKIKKHFHPRITQEMTKDQLMDSVSHRKIIDSLNSCCCNLLILEDLTVQHIEPVINFINKIPKDIFVLALPIFSVQHTNEKLEHHINYDDYRKVELDFDKSNLFHEVVIFNELTKQDVEIWLQENLEKLKGPQENKENVINDIVASHNAQFSGLKGLTPKINLL